VRAIITAIFAGLLPVAGITTAWAVDATHEPTEVVATTVTTTEPPVVSLTNYEIYVAKESLPTTTLPDLSGVDWVALARQEHGICGEWYDLAVNVIGWPSEEWSTLSYVMNRESSCRPEAFNKTDPNGGSRGLLQINGYWCRPTQWNPNGWLQDLGILTTCDDLYTPETNLRAGLAMWAYGEEKHGCGWRGPWATKCS